MHLKGFEIDIVVNGEPLPTLNGALKARFGANYEIEITNRTSAPAVFVIGVDGLDVITQKPFCTSAAGYVVDPGMKSVVKGWRDNDDMVSRFVFRRPEDSFAVSTGVGNADVGHIRAAVWSAKGNGSWPLRAPGTGELWGNHGSDAATLYRSIVSDNTGNTPMYLRSMARNDFSSNRSSDRSDEYSLVTEDRTLSFCSIAGTGYGEQISDQTTHVRFVRDKIVALFDIKCQYEEAFPADHDEETQTK